MFEVYKDGQLVTINNVSALPLNDAMFRVPLHAGMSIVERYNKGEDLSQYRHPPFGDESWPFVTHEDGSVTITVYGMHYEIRPLN